MELKDFVSSTIMQVMEAVSETQGPARALGGYVNPTAQTHANGDHLLGNTATDQAIYPIEFDVAVTVGSESGVEGGGKLHVASIISLGGKAKSGESLESVSRVKFTVPITLPVDTASDQERTDRAAKLKAEQERAIANRPRTARI